jgi:hypothetical protein
MNVSIYVQDRYNMSVNCNYVLIKGMDTTRNVTSQKQLFLYENASDLLILKGCLCCISVYAWHFFYQRRTMTVLTLLHDNQVRKSVYNICEC